jgi:hypothetical protein
MCAKEEKKRALFPRPESVEQHDCKDRSHCIDEYVSIIRLTQCGGLGRDTTKDWDVR